MIARRERFKASGGFTLLEMIIVISIMAIVAGAAIPLASAAINSKARRATLSELEGLQSAAAEYFRDTGVLPSSTADMEQNPSVAGWTGPYLAAFSIDRNSGLSQYAVDAWSQPYRFTASGSRSVRRSCATPPAPSTPRPTPRCTTTGSRPSRRTGWRRWT